ncbi:hypothetical protein [Enterococcus mundtii]|uniref:Uncharacterized protein n=1 Tax=Enterococcus mundtii TaxID=53346 RepID=A0A848MXT7_ENTMU|nr:hypothetical protein [Enterococcus mundtii]NMP59664.1 hypothetical protein [Enterococcus mundtii]
MKLTSNFKLIELGTQEREPSVTLSKYGLNFSKSAAACLKYSEYALLYLNDKERIIALVPATKGEKGAVRFYRPNKKTRKNPTINNERFIAVIGKLCKWDIESKSYYLKPQFLEGGKGIYLDLNDAVERERRRFGR